MGTPKVTLFWQCPAQSGHSINISCPNTPPVATPGISVYWATAREVSPGLAQTEAHSQPALDRTLDCGLGLPCPWEGRTFRVIPKGLWWEPWERAVTLLPGPSLPSAQPLRCSLTGPHGKPQLQGPVAQGIGQSLGQLYISVLKEPRGGP